MTRIGSVLMTGMCLLLFAGCGEAARPPAPPTAGLALELDDGRKWQVDEHTRHSAAEMSAIIGESPEIVTEDDARALGAAFDEELRSLVQGCTMTGAAHDQLHVFLAALFPRVKALNTATDIAGLRNTQQEIRSIFEAYEGHFH